MYVKNQKWGIQSAGIAGVSSGMGLGDGLLVCPCAFALVYKSKLELLMSLGRAFASLKNTTPPSLPPTCIYEGNLCL